MKRLRLGTEGGKSNGKAELLPPLRLKGWKWLLSLTFPGSSWERTKAGTESFTTQTAQSWKAQAQLFSDMSLDFRLWPERAGYRKNDSKTLVVK